MPDDDKLDDLLLRWESLAEEGREVAAEELCEDCPDLAEPLRHRITALKAMNWMTRPAAPEASVQPWTGQPDRPRLLAGRYRLDRLVGQGGYAQVWRGFDLELQRPVAVKVPKPSRRFSAVEIERFLAEARKVAALRHPGIVAVHDVVKVEGAYIIVADWIDGCDLRERLRQRKPPSDEAASIVAGVARSLDYAHRQGVIHRDIKPANILLDAQDRPLLCDFGAATEHLVAAPGERTGTLPYCSPEQAQGRPLDARSDIWSVGVVLYEALTGRLPFDVDDPVALREKILTEAPVPPRAIAKSIPPPLEQVCLRCLAKRPDRRYPTAAALADDLDAWLARRSNRRGRRRLLALGLLLTSGAGAALLLATRLLRQGESRFPSRAETWQEIQRFKLPRSHANSVVFTPDGRRLLTGGLDFTLRLWDIDSGEEVRCFRGHEAWVRAVALSPDGRLALSASGGVDLGKGRLALGTDHTVRLWEVATGKELRRYGGHKLPVVAVAFSPGGERFLSGAEDGTVRLWAVGGERELRRFSEGRGQVRGVAFAPDGQRAASGGSDRLIHLWDVNCGEELRRYEGHTDQVESVCFSPDGRLICSGGKDKAVRIWDALAGGERLCLKGHSYYVTSVAFAPGGDLVLSGGLDGTVRLWEVGTGRQKACLTGHEGGVTSVAASRDGCLAASGSEDGTVRVWRLAD